MFNTSDEEKVVLIHLILETSANVFFNMIYPIMSQFGEHYYFKKHSEADVKHEKMANDLLINLSPAQYQRLIEIQSQGWAIMFAALDRIAELAI
jgi:pyrroloquinoline quinone (PQQ) biosynthesis protein C